MLEETHESNTRLLAAFLGTCVIVRSTACEQAILMFPGISRQTFALGPIQAIFLLSSPRIAVLFQTLYQCIEISRHRSGIDDLTADGFYQIEYADTAGALFDTTVTRCAGP